MLRREFIKNTTLTVGGITLVSKLIFAEDKMIEIKPRRINSRNLQLHGTGKNGCATPPHFQDMIESGLNNIDWQ